MIDFQGAYLNSTLHVDHPPEYMRIYKELSAIAVKIKSDFAKYIQGDGTLMVLLKKALYGWVWSSSVWYKTLTHKLTRLGRIKNEQDICVFNKIDSNGNQITVIIHADDLTLTV